MTEAATGYEKLMAREWTAWAHRQMSYVGTREPPTYDNLKHATRILHYTCTCRCCPNWERFDPNR